jgi:hypothetical protein
MQRIFAALIISLAAWPTNANARAIHYISCEMVRAYVAQVGLVRARAIAMAHGMTPAQERIARRCLE